VVVILVNAYTDDNDDDDDGKLSKRRNKSTKISAYQMFTQVLPGLALHAGLVRLVQLNCDYLACSKLLLKWRFDNVAAVLGIFLPFF